MNFVLLCVWEDANAWAHWFQCTSGGPYPVVSRPQCPQGAPPAVAAVGDDLMVGILFPLWIPSGLTVRVAVMWLVDGCNIPWLLIQQATFFFTPSTKSKWLERMKFMEQHDGRGIEIMESQETWFQCLNISVHWVNTEVIFSLALWPVKWGTGPD